MQKLEQEQEQEQEYSSKVNSGISTLKLTQGNSGAVASVVALQWKRREQLGGWDWDEPGRSLDKLFLMHIFRCEALSLSPTLS